ncbi:UNVERIFIED_CONTAM: hypothetical protein HDU68_006328 [Siphonaria sp. JEL0065]|nr:hypothetical protein HDU68_006328 [Siphonaria sp. JEL0065]
MSLNMLISVVFVAATAAAADSNEVSAQKALAVLTSSPVCGAKCFQTAKLAAFAKSSSVDDFSDLCYSSMWAQPSLLQCAFSESSGCHDSDLDQFQAQAVNFIGLCEATIISLSPIPENLSNGLAFYYAGVPDCAANCLEDTYIPNFSKWVEAYLDVSTSGSNISYVQQGAMDNALNLVCQNYNMTNYSNCAKSNCTSPVDLESANNFATNSTAYCALALKKSTAYLAAAWQDLARMPLCARQNCVTDQSFANESHYFLWTLPTLPKLTNICMTYDTVAFESCASQQCNASDVSIVMEKEGDFGKACNYYLAELNLTRSSGGKPSASGKVATATGTTSSNGIHPTAFAIMSVVGFLVAGVL